MKLLEVVEETEAGQRLNAQMVASAALILLAKKLTLPEGIARSYDANESRDSTRFRQAWEWSHPLMRDFALPISDFSAKFLETVTDKLAASILSAMPDGAKLFECRALPMPCGLDTLAQICSPPDGLGLRYIMAYDINIDSFPCRFDIQFRFE